MTPIEQAAAIFARGWHEQCARPAREAAQRAHYAGGPSVDELERRIVARRTRHMTQR